MADTSANWIYRALVTAGKFAALLCLIWLATQVFDRYEAQFNDLGRGTQVMLSVGLLLTYALLIAVPFVPGIELGLSILLVKGAEAAPGVYLATVAGLSFAFCVGRFVRFSWIENALSSLGLHGMGQQLRGFQSQPYEIRLSMLQSRLPKWSAWILGRFRYLMLAGLINLPGSAVIGGGGGIMIMAGLSRLFSTPATIVTICCSVLPIPLLVWIFGAAPLQRIWQG